MNNKEELKKQLIVLTIILIFVIILAILLNTGKKDKNFTNVENNITNNVIQEEKTEEQKMLDNLKGLLQEPEEDEEYIQDETQGTENKTITTNNGETVIIKE